jgi:hypothetical protein
MVERERGRERRRERERERGREVDRETESPTSECANRWICMSQLRCFYI